MITASFFSTASESGSGGIQERKDNGPSAAKETVQKRPDRVSRVYPTLLRKISLVSIGFPDRFYMQVKLRVALGLASRQGAVV